MDAILQDARQKSVTLLDLGVNVNFAPVADVSTDPSDFMYDRSFGQDAQATADYVAQVVGVMEQEHIGSVLKHFPGYGSNEDTHTGIAVDERPYETFQTSDFLPFQAGIQAGADAVLVSHNVVTALDGTLPASLSPAVHQVLREELGFDGGHPHRRPGHGRGGPVRPGRLCGGAGGPGGQRHDPDHGL